MFGLVDIIVGTVMPMRGKPAAGKRHHAHMLSGSLLAGSIVMTDMYSSKAGGDKIAA
jgi:hypothetical protein